MALLFKEEDIPALDFILKELSFGTTLISSDDLVNAGFLDGKNRNRQNIFHYYAEILANHQCCEINKKLHSCWALGIGTKTLITHNNGGFAAIFKTQIEEGRKIAERQEKERTLLNTNIKQSKWDYRWRWITLGVAIISMAVSIIALFRTV